ncbi:MAG: type I-C CRISPR-associated protein Cas5c, partial [Planctomycetia bacterium]|nr:type I-C CRISPR-associated protein Cas5c [Planctomycetia bacterium]
MGSYGFCLEVSGEFACFTRPEMKVERVSYDVITPSAARAVFEAILWKPAIVWNIRKIEVMNPVRWISIRRNEVGNVMSPRSDGILIEDCRQQRASLMLRDVRYRIHGDFRFIPPEQRDRPKNPIPAATMEFLLQQDPEELEAFLEFHRQREQDVADVRSDETEAKYAAMFERRAKKGQYFRKPYLGCRECAADVILIRPGTSEAEESPIAETRDLGWMLYDMDFVRPESVASPGKPEKKKKATSSPVDYSEIRPLFFRAAMKD